MPPLLQDSQEISAGQRNIAGTALIGKACDVLDAVGSASEPLSQARIAEKTRIPRATLYRILSALASRGLIRNDPLTQCYSLGYRIFEYAQTGWTSSDLVSMAAGELRRLRDITGETCYLAALQGASVLSLGRFEGAHSRRSSAELGATKPVHCTGQGKAILAHLSDPQIDALLSKAPLESFTERTITDPDILKAQLRIIKSRGFAIDEEEILPGTCCVAAAILDSSGRPVGAISVAGPSFRITPERAERLGPELAEAATRVAAQLKSTPTTTLSTEGESVFVPLSKNRAFLGSSPLWHTGRGELYWLDKLAPALHTDNGRQIILEHQSASIDGAVLHPTGAALAIGGKLIKVENDQIAADIRIPLPPALSVLCTHISGVIWAATFDERQILSSIGPLIGDGCLQPMWELPGQVSGMAFSAEGDVLYASVGERGLIYSLESRTGRKRVLSKIPKGSGMPAGLTVDQDDRLWVALREGWSAARLNQDGDFAQVLALPVPAPTCLAFGGPDLSSLYVTSESVGLPIESLSNAPLSGRLLIGDIGIKGMPEPMADLTALGC